MNTLTQNRVAFNTASRPIGENTTNVAFNLPDRAFKILNDCAKPNRSALIRAWIAEGIQKRNRFAGLAFRAAIGLKNFAQSIFSNAPYAEREAAFQAGVEAVKEKVANDVPTGGAKIVSEAVEEFADESKFIPKN